jgi:hypothetical protein
VQAEAEAVVEAVEALTFWWKQMQKRLFLFSVFVYVHLNCMKKIILVLSGICI